MAEYPDTPEVRAEIARVTEELRKLMTERFTNSSEPVTAERLKRVTVEALERIAGESPTQPPPIKTAFEGNVFKWSPQANNDEELAWWRRYYRGAYGDFMDVQRTEDGRVQVLLPEALEFVTTGVVDVDLDE